MLDDNTPFTRTTLLQRPMVDCAFLPLAMRAPDCMRWSGILKGSGHTGLLRVCSILFAFPICWFEYCLGAHAILFEETKTDTLKMYPGDLGKNVCGDLGKSKAARFDCEV